MRKKHSCGYIHPTGCTLYTGEFPAFAPESNFVCNPNLDDIIETFGAEIDKINAFTSLAGLNKRCYTLTAPLTHKSFAQETIDKVCNLETGLAQARDLIDNLNIGAHHITIDLKCLKPAAAPCQGPTDTYTLLAILNLLVNEVCAIKQHLNL